MVRLLLSLAKQIILLPNVITGVFNTFKLGIIGNCDFLEDQS